MKFVSFAIFSSVVCILSTAFCFTAKAELQSFSRTYTSGFAVASKLGTDLQQALPTEVSKQLDTRPLTLEPGSFPLLTPVSTNSENHPRRQICISAGLINLLSHLCHAKAIDNVQPGFFKNYVQQISPNGAAPDITESSYWTDAILNDQMSYFNQAVGMITAINLSHQYLGHYNKYYSRMASPGSRTTPINDFLTTDEWQVSFRAGAVNALNCALATDGLRALFDALDSMPQRPAWADYIVPPHTDLKQLNRELSSWENDFFKGSFK